MSLAPTMPYVLVCLESTLRVLVFATEVNPMRLLDAKEVAEILQVNVQRVYELTRQGILPSIRIGPRQVRYEETRLMQWIVNMAGG
jgi:excisionase family DNA binding protein